MILNHDGYCYIRNEPEGTVGANEFASIIYYFIDRDNNILADYANICKIATKKTGEPVVTDIRTYTAMICKIYQSELIKM